MPMSNFKKRILNVDSSTGHYFSLTTQIKNGQKLSPIFAQLDEIGEPFSREDLRTSKGPLGQLLLRRGKKPITIAHAVDQIILSLQAHGEVIPVSDWLETPGLLQLLGEQRLLTKLFASELWANQSEDMAKLWDQIPQPYKEQVPDFSERYNTIRIPASAEFLPVPGLAKEELLTPSATIGHAPLQDHRTWNNWDKIEALLGASRLTPEDLLQTGSGTKPFLRIAFEAGKLSKIEAHVRHGGRKLTRDHYTTAGLESYLVTCDLKLHRAAEEDDGDLIDKLCHEGIVDIESRYKKYTPILVAITKKANKALARLLANGGNADTRVSSEKSSFSALWLASQEADEEGFNILIGGLQTQFADDPVRLLQIFHSPHDGRPSPLAYLKDARNAKKVATLGEAVSEAAKNAAALPIEDLVSQDGNRKSGVELIAQAGHLSLLFTADRWITNPRGMHQLASQVPEAALTKQMSGTQGTQSYKATLALVNALTLKRGRSVPFVLE